MGWIDNYALIYGAGATGLIAVWPLVLIMVDVKSALGVRSVTAGRIVRGCCAVGIAFFLLMWYLAYARY